MCSCVVFCVFADTNFFLATEFITEVKKYYIVVIIDVLLQSHWNCVFFSLQTHLTFGKEFTQAVELKQVAQQEAEKARFLVEKVTVMKISVTLLSLI